MIEKLPLNLKNEILCFSLFEFIGLWVSRPYLSDSQAIRFFKMEKEENIPKSFLITSFICHGILLRLFFLHHSLLPTMLGPTSSLPPQVSPY